MEAALRTAYFALAGKELDNKDIEVVRGHNNAIIEATIPVPVKELGGKILKSAFVSSTAAIRVSLKCSTVFASIRTATTSSKS